MITPMKWLQRIEVQRARQSTAFANCQWGVVQAQAGRIAELWKLFDSAANKFHADNKCFTCGSPSPYSDYGKRTFCSHEHAVTFTAQQGRV